MKNIAGFYDEDKEMEYHQRQIEKPYRSTVFFEKFLSNHLCMDNINILDIACGAGGVTSYIANRHKNCNFLGIDIWDFSEYFLDELSNISFELGDIYNLNPAYIGRFNGIMLVQTLSWIPNYKNALEEMCKLKADWIALSLLGYDGKINFNIEIEDYERTGIQDDCFLSCCYNIYSLPLLELFFKGHGYKEFIFHKFEIDIDLEKPENKDMGTYTIMTAEGHRLQISGALLMPWYFVLVKK